MEKVKPAEYSGEGFKVTYDKNLCTHSAVCVKTLPKVFDPKKKPWVNTSAASKKEIKEMILKCPSRALQFHEE